MSLCAEFGVGISFLTEYGRFLARVQGPISGNVLLRKQQ
jgi:CRISPR-associated protein Cas1